MPLTTARGRPSAGYSRRENPFSPLCFRTVHETFALTPLLATQASVIGTPLRAITHPRSLAHALSELDAFLPPVISTLTRLPYNQITRPAPVPSCVAAPRQLIRRLSRRPLLLGVSSTPTLTVWSPTPYPMFYRAERAFGVLLRSVYPFSATLGRHSTPCPSYRTITTNSLTW